MTMKYKFSTSMIILMCAMSFKYYCCSQTKQNGLICIVLLMCYLVVVGGKAG